MLNFKKIKGECEVLFDFITVFFILFLFAIAYRVTELLKSIKDIAFSINNRLLKIYLKTLEKENYNFEDLEHTIPFVIKWDDEKSDQEFVTFELEDTLELGIEDKNNHSPSKSDQ